MLRRLAEWWPERWRLHVTLRVRFALLMAAAVTILGGVNGFYFELRILEELEKELELRALNIGRYLRAESIDPLLRHDLVALQEILSDAKQNDTDVVYAFIMDPADHVVAHTFEGAFPEDLRFLNRYREREGFQVRRVAVFGEHFRDFALPLYHAELGVLRLAVHDGRILDRVAAARREQFAFLFVVMVLSATAAYAFTYFALKPLSAITDALERFEPGRHCEAIVPRRRDEIGELARRVNLVTARLHESHTQMMQAEKMAAAGLLASGIAHEINNPISGLQNCLRRIQTNPADVRQTREYAALMLQATEHIETVVRGLLDFSRSSARPACVVDLCRAARKALHLSAFRLERNHITVERSIPDQPLWVRGDEAQLIQVVVNVLLNAVDAMPNGGSLEVHLGRRDDLVTLRIRDHGVGISAEELPRIFEPFFTTKAAGKGTGLGLAVTHAIIVDHAGWIGVRSTPGSGTEIDIQLPVCPQDEASRHEAA